MIFANLSVMSSGMMLSMLQYPINDYCITQRYHLSQSATNGDTCEETTPYHHAGTHYNDPPWSWSLKSPTTRLLHLFNNTSGLTPKRKKKKTFVKGIHRWPVESPYKEWQVMQKAIPYHSIIKRNLHLEVMEVRGWKIRTKESVVVGVGNLRANEICVLGRWLFEDVQMIVKIITLYNTYQTLCMFSALLCFVLIK